MGQLCSHVLPVSLSHVYVPVMSARYFLVSHVSPTPCLSYTCHWSLPCTFHNLSIMHWCPWWPMVYRDPAGPGDLWRLSHWKAKGLSLFQLSLFLTLSLFSLSLSLSLSHSQVECLLYPLWTGLRAQGRLGVLNLPLAHGLVGTWSRRFGMSSSQAFLK